jgi:hypothetical protein
MMGMETLLAMLGGTIAGLLHAGMLWRAARKVSPWTATFGLLRVLLIGALLVVAAVHGQILVAAGAWAVGFAMAANLITVADSKRSDSKQAAD